MSVDKKLPDCRCAEEEGERHVEQLRTILEHLTEGVVISDLQGNLYHWNRAAIEMHGFQTLDECRRHLPEFVDTFELSTSDGQILPVEQWPLARILRGETLENWEVHVRRLDRRFNRVWLYGGTLARDVAGNPLLAVITVTDITERKQAEEELKESEARLKRSQAMAHLGSWELDVANDVLTWSDEVYRLFGLQPQEFKATYGAFLEAVHPDDRNAVDKAYSESLQEGRDTYEIEHRLVRKSNGEVRIVHEKCEHKRDQSGRVIRSVGMQAGRGGLARDERTFGNPRSGKDRGVGERESGYSGRTTTSLRRPRDSACVRLSARFGLSYALCEPILQRNVRRIHGTSVP